MLSLPTLAQPARAADKSTPTRPIRDVIVPPRTRCRGTPVAVEATPREDRASGNHQFSGRLLWTVAELPLMRIFPAKRLEPEGRRMRRFTIGGVRSIRRCYEPARRRGRIPFTHGGRAATEPLTVASRNQASPRM